MIKKENVLSLQAALLDVQNRIAFRLSRSEAVEHTVFLSVAIVDRSGTPLQIIDSTKPTSSHSVLTPSDNGLFAPGIPLNTQLRRVAAMSEIASYIFALNNDSNVVVNATYQDEAAGSGTRMNYALQCYLKDGKLVLKETQIADQG